MSASSLILRGRTAAERLMVDTCTIRRRGGGSTVDDDTGVITPNRSTVYTGKCRVQQQTAQAQQETPGEDFQLLVRLEVQLPMSVTGVQVGDEIEVTASALDPDLVGQVFVVRDLFAKTHATARRIGVTRRTS